MNSFVADILKKSNKLQQEKFNDKVARSSYVEWSKLLDKFSKETHKPWLESYDIFLMDNGEPPSNHYRLARLDNQRPFEPGNVIWIGPKGAQYSKNRPYSHRSNSKRVEWEGVLYTVPEFAAKFGLSAAYRLLAYASLA
ncbi:hypothetical protein 2050HW_00093 [Serratia phage vB_SmaM_ 2050HW]|uniref:Uncharacterized protein n=1 Tax=Serratia phage vB_SmaM_ 2050HW TaxID=2024252 RepID=A0A289ZTN6_9CAUD|nr:hypothetical protein HWB23_gp093 [Serratia phage vB_SmaM_ 2050HW]ATA65428.1 hypothetical protein 2050HW_00093 [Serratia phage vB_SmaM_ 2050HW]